MVGGVLWGSVGMRCIAHQLAILPLRPLPGDDNNAYGNEFGEGVGDDDDDEGGVESRGAVSASRAPSPQQPGSAGQSGPGRGLHSQAPLDEDAISWLIQAGSTGAAAPPSPSKGARGWAGASHWRYRAVQGEGAEEEDAGSK
jgi:hypothetical protein